MPELPEVETVKRGLEKTIINKVIADFESDWHKAVNHPVKFYRAKLQGARVKGLRRRAKMLIIEFNNGWNILVHLKMTGQLVYRDMSHCLIGGHSIASSCDNLPNKFTHAIFAFKDGSHLYFNDIRKFGWVRLYDIRGLKMALEVMKMGPEPLEKGFSLKYLMERIMKRPKMRIKQFLMDNPNLVGVGNIYSDEVCFYAKVKPSRRVGNLSAAQIKMVYQGIRKILNAAIKARGTTFSNYVNVDGEAGAYTKQLKVYQRYGEKCYTCKSKIQRMKLGGRTSSYCPECQK
ncbi:MAG: bifunctional DNA-formamidopyrimidine glycosylase/DNA-(apurinic or apyrimidinic site) lyase [bacterium]